MTDSIRPAAVACQALGDAQGAAGRSTAVDRALELLRKCASELGYSYEALAVAMGHPPTYKSHVQRVFNGEKPLPLDFLIALPDDLEALWHSRAAEAFGRLVVTPAENTDAAVRDLVRGIFGVLSPSASLPTRANGMARADLASAAPIRKVGR